MAKRKSAGKSATKRKATAPRRRTAVKQKAAKRKTAARSAASRTRKKTPSAKPSTLAAAATLVRGAAAGAAAAVAARLPWAANENDPIALLETDHRRFEDLMKSGEETTARAVKRRTQLLATLTAELNVHEAIEEKILYPALKPHAEARDIVLEGYQEHHIADVLVKELNALAKDDEKWGAKFKVLQESLEHHIQEEEGNMFRTARAVLGREELDDLGKRMRALKRDLER
jgi:hemerythrin-like domain-containing protein